MKNPYTNTTNPTNAEVEIEYTIATFKEKGLNENDLIRLRKHLEFIVSAYKLDVINQIKNLKY